MQKAKMELQKYRVKIREFCILSRHFDNCCFDR